MVSPGESASGRAVARVRLLGRIAKGVVRDEDDHADHDERGPRVPVLDLADRAGDRRPRSVAVAERRPSLGDRDHNACRQPDQVAEGLLLADVTEVFLPPAAHPCPSFDVGGRAPLGKLVAPGRRKGRPGAEKSSLEAAAAEEAEQGQHKNDDEDDPEN